MTDLDAAVVAAHDRYRSFRPASATVHERARRVMPGGNTRSVLDFEPFPFRIASAAGAELVDVDGHRYVDFCGNYTAGLLGHSPDAVRVAVIEALDRGWALGAMHEAEIELAEMICERFASIEQVRFTNSGTEANLMAIGTALHHTGRTGVGVFDQAYHGGVLGFGAVGGPHHPLNVPHDFRVAPFDDVDALDALFGDHDRAQSLGCVLVEPVQGSGGCRPASVEFLRALRDHCDDAGVVLIFDEVMTSRLAPGGAQERFGVSPDMTTLGKYLGGGFSFGAFGGHRDIMGAFDRQAGGTLTQAGTFNNNVASMTAAVTTLRHELPPERILAVNDRGDRLRNGLGDLFARSGLDIWVSGLGSMSNVRSHDDRLLDLLFHHLLADGLYIARRGFIALSVEIGDDDCDRLLTSTQRWIDAVRVMV